ncbi:4-diphosphocytidyl-2-C-methyl-D-erythritol kinase chloroplastic-like, partial [Trifolium pratense]
SNHAIPISQNPFKTIHLPQFRPNGSSNFHSKLHFQRPHFLKVRAMVSDSSRKKLEIVYDPDERINKLADKIDNDAPLSRLTLFSPCKINVFLRITNKREDGYHDLASLFHYRRAETTTGAPLFAGYSRSSAALIVAVNCGKIAVG